VKEAKKPSTIGRVEGDVVKLLGKNWQNKQNEQ
jgi:hypothetical protein